MGKDGMTLDKFIKKVDLLSKKELDKVQLLAFYYQYGNADFCFTVNDVCSWFTTLDVHLPNKTRLKQNLSKSHKFLKGKEPDSFRLHANEIQQLSKSYPFMAEDDEEILCSDVILPSALYLKTRGYIESLAKQINSSYENNIFDGCAVLMRRLLEICLIHAYEYNRVANSIKDDEGNYKLLIDIINNAKNNTTFGLSRNTKDCLDDFRVIGNFSAHKIFYNAKKADIKKIVLEYRATIEELLYKAGLKK